MSSGVFRRERRAVFILGAMWNALVRGWRSDCVVGGMETRFQWRKAHNPYAKCEAFHIAPRLFFMFLFFIPLTIRQQSIIYPHKFSTEPNLPPKKMVGIFCSVPDCEIELYHFMPSACVGDVWMNILFTGATCISYPLNYGGTFAWLHFFAYFCEKNKWVKYPSNHKKGRCKKSTSDDAMNVGTCLGHVYNA